LTDYFGRNELTVIQALRLENEAPVASVARNDETNLLGPTPRIAGRRLSKERRGAQNGLLCSGPREAESEADGFERPPSRAKGRSRRGR